MDRITIRFTNEQKALLVAAARRIGQPVAAYIRDQALQPGALPNNQPNMQILVALDVITRLELLQITKSSAMTPEQAMEHYQIFRHDAEEKFRWQGGL